MLPSAGTASPEYETCFWVLNSTPRRGQESLMLTTAGGGT